MVLGGKIPFDAVDRSPLFARPIDRQREAALAQPGQRCARSVRKPPRRIDQLVNGRAAIPLKQFDDLRQLRPAAHGPCGVASLAAATRGRHNIQASRVAQPNSKRFRVRRIVGAGDLWVTEFILAYDGRPSYSVSVMEFLDGKVARETQYFADPFEPGPSRARWVERMG